MNRKALLRIALALSLMGLMIAGVVGYTKKSDSGERKNKSHLVSQIKGSISAAKAEPTPIDWPKIPVRQKCSDNCDIQPTRPQDTILSQQWREVRKMKNEGKVSSWQEGWDIMKGTKKEKPQDTSEKPVPDKTAPKKKTTR